MRHCRKQHKEGLLDQWKVDRWVGIGVKGGGGAGWWCCQGRVDLVVRARRERECVCVCVLWWWGIGALAHCVCVCGVGQVGGLMTTGDA